MPLPLRPLLVGHPRIADHGIGQVRAAILSDLADLELTDRERACGPSVWVYIPALAWSSSTSPDSASVQILAKAPSRCWTVTSRNGSDASRKGRLPGQGPSDVAAVLGQPHLFGDRASASAARSRRGRRGRRR